MSRAFVVTVLLLLLVVVVLSTTTAVTNAQHLIRRRAAISTALITLTPIPNIEILPTLAADIRAVGVKTPQAASIFTIPTAALVHSVSFIFNQLVPQIPFTCGTPQFNCRTVKCYVTCANTTYSIALRCNDVTVAPTAGAPSTVAVSPWRIVAIAQDRYEGSIDDQFSVTLAVQQRIKAGTQCHFAFVNDILGRGYVAGRLRGSVAITVARSLPFASGLAFHPSPALWNDTKTSVALSSFSSLTAHARCTSTGKVTVVADPTTTTQTAASNWTAACCYSASTRHGDCTVSYSPASNPSFFDSSSGQQQSAPSFSFRKTVFALTATADKVTDSSALFTGGGGGICATATSSSSSPARTLRVNTSAAASTTTNFVTSTALGRSLLDITSIFGTDTTAVGIFLCEDTSAAAAAPATTATSRVCALYVSNSSIVVFPPGFVLTNGGVATPLFTPLCESTNREFSPLGPLDDASSTSPIGAAQEQQFLLFDGKQPRGPCYGVGSRGACAAPCVWSTVWGVCLWGDTVDPAATTPSSSSSGTAVTLRSGPCAWPLANISAATADLRCRVPNSELNLDALLAHLCLKRTLASSEVSWCISSAFRCGHTAEVVVDHLMSFYCSATGAVATGTGTSASCADPSLSCHPNGTIATPPPSSQFVLSVIANRTTVDVSAALFETATSSSSSSTTTTTIVAAGGRRYVSVALSLVARGALFNLTAIRNDLAEALHPGFEPVVPPGSSNLGRFSIASQFRALFPDPGYAVTDVEGSNESVQLSTTLVIRIAIADSFLPLPGTTQYLDIAPPVFDASSSSSSSVVVLPVTAAATTTTTTVTHAESWMVPSVFTFQRVRISFTAAPAEPCSLAGLSAAAMIFGLMSGLGGWLNVAAVQSTLLGAHSTCAPERVRRCFSKTLGFVSPAKWIWSSDGTSSGVGSTGSSSDGGTSTTPSGGASASGASAITLETSTGPVVSSLLDRQAFWTQFLVIAIVLLLHMLLLRVYQYFAPLRGSPEQTLWWPAPTFYLCGLLAAGTVQSAWVVIFNDELAVMRVVSFFCFAALVGTVLPWWFLKLFRQEENYFQKYEYSRLFRQIQKEASSSSMASEIAPDTADVNADDSQAEAKQNETTATAADDGKKRRKKKDKNKENNSPVSSNSAAAISKDLASTTHISLRHNTEAERRRAIAESQWSSRCEKASYFIFTLFLPAGSWPHSRGMAPARDLFLARGLCCYFSWVSLVILGFAGLNFSYDGVDVELCKANYANMAVLHFFWAAFALYWRPFRVPVLNAMWVVARLIDFADSVVSANWIGDGKPDPFGAAIDIVKMKEASIAFMLIFSLLTFVVKLRESLSLLAQESGDHMERTREERRLDVQLLMSTTERNNNEEDPRNNNNSKSPDRAVAVLDEELSLFSPLSPGGGGPAAAALRHKKPPMGFSASVTDLLGVSPVVPLRAPPVSAAVLSAAESERRSNHNSGSIRNASPPNARAKTASPSPSPTRRIQISWSGNPEFDEIDADVQGSLSQRRTADRSQRTANMLATFGSLVRVQELRSSSKEEGSNDRNNKSSKTPSRERRDVDEEEEEEEEEQEQQQHRLANPIRLVATFADARDAVAAMQALAGRVDSMGTTLNCELLADDENYDFL